MSDHLAREPVRPARRIYPRRIYRVAPTRLTGVDMRSRVGRAYTAAFIGALQEFPGVAPDRIAEVVRLRTLATLSQEACLTGRGSADEALKAANVAARAGRDLRLAMNAKPADVGGAQ